MVKFIWDFPQKFCNPILGLMTVEDEEEEIYYAGTAMLCQC